MNPKHEFDKSAECGYRAYRELLSRYEDENKLFHSNGVDEQLYKQLANIQSAVKIDNITIAVGVEDAPMIVSPERCNKLVGKYLETNTGKLPLISLIPAEAAIDNLESIRGALPNSSLNHNAIFCSFDPINQSLEDFTEKASMIDVRVFKLIHPRTNTSSSLNLFELDIDCKKDGLSGRTTSLTEVVNNMHDREHNTEDKGKILINIGGEFKESEEQELWTLFRTRFDDISENLPMILEENEEATLKLLRDNRFIFVRKVDKDDRLMASAFMSDNPETYPWINQEFIKSVYGKDEKTSQMFIPGIAAYRGVGRDTIEELLTVLAKTASSSNYERLLVGFECTDVSSCYIPAISKIALKKSNIFEKVVIEQPATKHYLLLSI